MSDWQACDCVQTGIARWWVSALRHVDILDALVASNVSCVGQRQNASILKLEGETSVGIILYQKKSGKPCVGPGGFCRSKVISIF